MIVAGIDFGLKKVGVALADGILAEPYLVIRYIDIGELVKKITEIVEKEKIEKIVIGISDGEIAKRAREFGELLKMELNLPVEFFDEALSTQDAQRLAIESGMKRSKRKEMEDAFAASVMLQSYLDYV